MEGGDKGDQLWAGNGQILAEYYRLCPMEKENFGSAKTGSWARSGSAEGTIRGFFPFIRPSYLSKMKGNATQRRKIFGMIPA